MTRLLLAGAAALGLMTSVALAQTSSSSTSTTTTTTPPVLAPLTPPPAGTLSRTTVRKSVAPNGTRTESTQTTYGNANGVASDTVTNTTTSPPPITATTSRETTTTVTR